MALVIHIYAFRDKPEHRHLALELTAMPTARGDEFANYISYYAYQNSYTHEVQNRSMTKMARNGAGVGGGGACYLYATPYSVKGFGAATKQHDQSNLTPIETIVISTQEDGCQESPYSEKSIQKEWSVARDWTLDDGRTYRPQTMYRNETPNFKIPFEFDIHKRHCGTIVHNVLEGTNIATPREAQDCTPGFVGRSLEATINLAKNNNSTLESLIAENPINYISRNIVEQTYLAYRSHKWLFGSDHLHMSQLKKLLTQTEGCTWISKTAINSIFDGNIANYMARLTTSSPTCARALALPALRDALHPNSHTTTEFQP